MLSRTVGQWYAWAMDAEQLKALAVSRAKELGFVAAGCAAAGAAPHAESFRRWIADGRHASMDYMAQHIDKRCDTRLEWPWAKTVLCLAAAYVGDEFDSPVARYARGRDYHKVLKRRCRRLVDDLSDAWPDLQTRICVDTAPIAERDWAAAAGLGWVGANGCLIHPVYGSYLLLAEILLSVELEADSPVSDGCGDCRLCIETCPNGALTAPRTLDARRCNSYATLEDRGPLDADALDLDGTVIGCDLCQQACPHNRDVPRGSIDELIEPTALACSSVREILSWSEADWDVATRGSAARRAKYPMLLRNAAIVAGRRRLTEVVGRLAELAGHPAPIVRGAASWALRRLEGPVR